MLRLSTAAVTVAELTHSGLTPGCASATRFNTMPKHTVQKTRGEVYTLDEIVEGARKCAERQEAVLWSADAVLTHSRKFVRKPDHGHHDRLVARAIESREAAKAKLNKARSKLCEMQRAVDELLRDYEKKKEMVEKVRKEKPDGMQFAAGYGTSELVTAGLLGAGVGAGVMAYAALRQTNRLAKTLSQTCGIVGTIVEEIVRVVRNISDTVAKTVRGAAAKTVLAVATYSLMNLFGMPPSACVLGASVLVYGGQQFADFMLEFASERGLKFVGSSSPTMEFAAKAGEAGRTEKFMGLFLLTSLLYKVGGSLVERKTAMGLFLDNFTRFWEDNPAVELWTLVVNCSVKVLEFLTKVVPGTSVPQALLDYRDKLCPERAHVHRWLRDIDKLVGDIRAGEVVADINVIAALRAERHVGLSYMQCFVALRRDLQAVLNRVETVLSEYGDVNTSGVRQEPVTLIISGKPGVGKTSMMPFLVQAVLTGIVPWHIKALHKGDLTMHVFNKDSGPYWESYHGQTATCFDDLGQYVQAEGQDGPLQAFMSAVSTWKVPLNMASLTNKGKTFFTSPLVVATTNVGTDSGLTWQKVLAGSVHEPSAFVRRLQFCVEPFVRPEFALPNGQLDGAKFHAELGSLSDDVLGLMDRVWMFRRVQHVVNGPAVHLDSEEWTASMLVRQVVNTVKAKATSTAAMRMQLSSLREQLEGMRFAAGYVDTAKSYAWRAVAAVQTAFSTAKLPAFGDRETKANIDGDGKAQTDIGTISISNVHYEDAYSLFIGPRVVLGQYPIWFGGRPRAISIGQGHDAEWQWVRAADVQHLLAKRLTYLQKLGSAVNLEELEEYASLLRLSRRVAELRTTYGDFVIHVAVHSRRPDVDSLGITWKLLFRSATVSILVTLAVHAILIMLRVIVEAVTGRVVGKKKKKVAKQEGMRFAGGGPDSPKKAWQAYTGREVVDSVVNTVKRNMVRLYVQRDGESYFFSNALRLYDFEVLCNAHFFLETRASHYTVEWEDGTRKTFTAAEWKALAPSAEQRLHSGVDYVQVTIEHPNNVRAPNITRHFLNGDPVEQDVVGTTVYSWVERPGFAPYFIRTDTAVQKEITMRDTQGIYGGQTFTLSGTACLFMKVRLDIGDCGWPVFVRTKTGRVAIYGIVAGADPSQEQSIATRVELVPVEKGSDMAFAGRHIAGTHDANLTRCNQSQYRQGVFDVLPASGKVPVSLSREEMARAQAQLPEKAELAPERVDRLKQAAAAVYAKLFNGVPSLPVHASVATFETALFGDYDAKPLPGNTSTGYPLASAGVTLKSKVKEDPTLQSRLRTMCEDVETALMSGDQDMSQYFLYTDILKDEPRKVGKGARLVSACPIQASIVTRQYFLRFTDILCKRGMDYGFCVNINPFGPDWHALAMRLLEKGQVGIDGDFKSFDFSHGDALMRTFLDAADAYYPEVQVTREVRRRLFEMVVLRSRHIDGPDVWEWDCGMPSGNPLTAALNTWCNLVLHVAVYSDLTGRAPIRFFDDVAVALMGDDNVSVPRRELLSVWTYSNLHKAFAAYGYEYTTADKGDVHEATHKPLTELSFLKRGFVIGESGRFVAPRELTSLAKQIEWVSRRGTLLENLEDAFVELSLHPLSTWNKYAPALLREMHVRFYRPAWLPLDDPVGPSGRAAAFARATSKAYEFD